MKTKKKKKGKDEGCISIDKRKIDKNNDRVVNFWVKEKKRVSYKKRDNRKDTEVEYKKSRITRKGVSKTREKQCEWEDKIFHFMVKG